MLIALLGRLRPTTPTTTPGRHRAVPVVHPRRGRAWRRSREAVAAAEAVGTRRYSADTPGGVA